MRSLRHAIPFVFSLGLLGGCNRHDAEEHPSALAESVVILADGPKGAAAVWGANYFPNIELVTQKGEKVHFFDDLVKDKVVALNFIYTSCPDACPMETARLVQVQKLLGDRMGKDIFFYSISIDPGHDTPEVLDAYSKKWKTGPGWTFLTGKEEDIVALRKKLGVYDADAKRTDHSLSMVIGNQKTGRWMKRSPFENPYVLADQLGSWLSNWSRPADAKRDYADAPQVRNISAGEEMFRARCEACHTVGGGDKTEVEEHRVGPDLLNVGKRRERAWLEKWLMHPDDMLKEGDPIAAKLFTDYKEIKMPNFRLQPGEVDNLLGYIEQESASAEYRAELAHAASASAAPAPAPAPIAPMGPVPAAAMASVNDMLTSYESLRDALAKDDLPAAQKAAKTIAENAKKAAADAGPAQKGLGELADGAASIATATDIDAARKAFGDVSKHVVALLVENADLRKGHFLFLCPMAKGYQKWVQTTATLNNPYWGKKMLTCGRELTAWEV